MESTQKIGDSPLFFNRSFRLLFAGNSISVVGDQFTLVALPWLVLSLTGSATQLGLVLAVMAVPRAALMLIGGAIVDLMSPRDVLLAARISNASMLAALATTVLLGATWIGLLYILAAGIGIASAFAYPADSSLLPQIVSLNQLQSANSMLIAVRQLSMLIGPVAAGVIINVGSKAATSHIRGIGLAFAIDAISFLFSVYFLFLIDPKKYEHSSTFVNKSFVNPLGGIRTIWRDAQLRMLIGYMAVVSILMSGPLQVGLPILAKARFSEGATAYGLLVTASGAGMLFGSIASGIMMRVGQRRLGLILLGADVVTGLGISALSIVHSLASGLIILSIVGLIPGCLQVAFMTWLQSRVPQALMGRTTSLVMFVFLGLGPLSAALTGGLLTILSLNSLLITSGLVLSGVALFGLSRQNLRAIRY